MKNKILIILIVSAIVALSGLGYWQYYYNTPVALEYGSKETVFKIDNVSGIVYKDGYWYIDFVNKEAFRVYSVSKINVLSRKHTTIKISPREALTSSQ
jgi:hypothetical protein